MTPHGLRAVGYRRAGWTWSRIGKQLGLGTRAAADAARETAWSMGLRLGTTPRKPCPHRTVLRDLQELGPASAWELATEYGRGLHGTHEALRQLYQQGRVYRSRQELPRWRCAPRGRAVVWVYEADEG